MNIKEIQELIRFVSKAGVTEVQLEQGDFKITIKTQSDEEKSLMSKLSAMQSSPQQVFAYPQPQQQMQQAPAVAEAAKPVAEAAPVVIADNTVVIKSPMIGTFYRKPSPDKEVFVKVGDKVTKGQVVCIIEAMKLFNEIESEVSGTIVKVVADDVTPVEYDQPLFIVQP